MSIVKVGLEYSKPVPEAWERAVWSIAPPSNFLTWLKIVWEPGDVWEPVERYMIYQMRAPRLCRPEILAALRGPSPRSTGHYCAQGYCLCAMKANRWRGGATSMIDYAQWRLFQATGHFGKRWWCIQGDQGGHRHQLDQIEAKVSRIFGGPSDTPAPGDLPYADFDLRTFRKVAELDRVRMWKGVTDYTMRNHATMDAEEKDEGERARWALWSWLESQVKQTVQKIGHKGANALKDAAPRTLGKPVHHLDEEAIQQDFIQGE
jgi:hypothetical protein